MGKVFRYYIVIVFCCAFSGASVQAEPSPWLNPLSPYVQRHKEALSPQETPSSLNGRCVKDIPFVIRPANYLNAQLEQITTMCAVQTAFGFQSATTSRITLNETGVSGIVAGSFSAKPLLQPIPYSKHLMFLDASAPDGTYPHIIKNFVDSIDIAKLADKSLQFNVKPSASIMPITNSFKEKLVMRDVRFSDSGKWMISDVPYVGMTRVNIETGETLIFGPAMRYNIGLNPRFATAISNDGRYAVIAEHTYALFRIYDLSTCVPTPDLRKAQTCQWKDLLPTVRAAISGYGGATSIDFSTQTTLRFTALQNQQQALFTITAGGEIESRIDYLATGDSFASGEGAYNYKPYTDSRDPFNSCHVSLLSYPFLVQGLKDLGRTDSVACSGAKIHDMYPTNPAGYISQAAGKPEASFDADIFNDFLAGYRPQGNHVKNAKPKIVTTSIGGNDIGFAKIISRCVMPTTCYNTPQDSVDLAATIESLYPKLLTVYGSIKQDAATAASVYAVGYPEMTDPEGNCALNVHLNATELLLANQIVVAINSVVQRAAIASGISYINVTKALAGHRLCETSSANIAVNGLTAGNDKTFTIPLYKTGYQADFYLIGKESYHPNQLGHRLLANVIAQAISTQPASSTPYTNSLLQDGTNLQPRRIVPDNTQNQPFWIAGKPASLESSGFAPNTAVSLIIAGRPTPLSPTTTNHLGIAQMSVSAPSNLIGLQLAQITGSNAAGEPIQVQKLVYIAGSENDIDNDTVQNNTEACMAVQASGIDTDKDGSDDACDNYIDEPPLSVAIPELSEPTPTVSLAVTKNTPQFNAIKAISSSATNEPTIVSAGAVLSQTTVQQNATHTTPNKPASATTPTSNPIVYKKRTPHLSLGLLLGLLLSICLALLWRKRS